MRRSHRSGALERLLSLLYVYPFRCQSCGHRFLTLRWRRRYTRVRDERREYERLPLSVPVMLSGLSGAAPGHATQISIDGCTVETEAPLSEGALVQVMLHVTPGAAPVAVEAAVVHGVLPHGGGLHFVRIQPGERDRLRQFVADLRARRTVGREPDPR
ncbi:MAG: PilZ domain-containing protein [Candidatus Rokuibacteriota bacterium]